MSIHIIGGGGSAGGDLVWISQSAFGASATLDIALPAGYRGFQLYVEGVQTDVPATFPIAFLRLGASSTPDVSSVYDSARRGYGASGSQADEDGITSIRVGNWSGDESGFCTIEVGPSYDDAAEVTTIIVNSMQRRASSHLGQTALGVYRVRNVVDVLQLATLTDAFLAQGTVNLWGKGGS